MPQVEHRVVVASREIPAAPDKLFEMIAGSLSCTPATGPTSPTGRATRGHGRPRASGSPEEAILERGARGKLARHWGTTTRRILEQSAILVAAVLDPESSKGEATTGGDASAG